MIKQEINEFIKVNLIGVLYFSGAICGACDVIKEKILHIIKDYKEVKLLEVNAIENKEIAAEYNIFSLPILLLFVDGKETLRIGRNFDILEFKKLVDRYYNMIF